MKLTFKKLIMNNTERVQLINQFRILALLDDSQRKDYEMQAEILERGYIGLYHKIFDVLSEEVPESTVRETYDILTMFRVLENAVALLPAEERSQFTFEFQGFDGNNDPHYSIAEFLIEKLGLYRELHGQDINSHHSYSIEIYRRMLAEFNAQQKEQITRVLPLESLKAIQAAALEE
ncbi:YfbU family protein [Hymenobacter sp. BT635]|uniref:YfbU family protein n=1 Tax=Hymenobacter nitidus TaxID=2880929 RepID=A0ABS8AHB0_9BACT|nr:YfbU family protein [Hymenobacter nitidus]MCB2379823.1 YfbU family protein [Hymenobacter nitidus]